MNEHQKSQWDQLIEYRLALATLKRKYAHFNGIGYVPPHIITEHNKAVDAIERIKDNLFNLGIAVESENEEWIKI